MSRFGKETGPRHKPTSDPGSKKLWRSLAALLLGLVMIGASASIFAGTASATGETNATGTWSGAGSANADPGCLAGQDVNWHWTLTAPAGSQLVSATLDVTYESGHTTTADGGILNGDTSVLHFYVGLAAPQAVQSASYSYTYTGDGGDFVMAIADSSCTGTPNPPEPTSVTPTAPTASQPSCDNPVKTVTPSNQDGVVWNPSGSTNLNPGDSVTYTASAAENYVIPQDAQKSFPFSNTFDTSTCGNGGGGSNGDNGTVKTHNVGTSTDDVRDEPKVDCNGFYLDAFGFDGVQQVSWHIVTDTHGDTVLSGTITLDDNGHGYTGKLNLPNGMYKLYWHFDGQNGADKHKVFKVEGDCTPPPPPPTTCPDGTPWHDANGNGVIDGNECTTLGPPPKAQCPNGTNPGDVNHDGVVNQADCEVHPGPTPKPKHHKKPVGPQLGTGSDGPTTLSSMGTDNQSELLLFGIGLLVMGISLSGGGVAYALKSRHGREARK